MAGGLFANVNVPSGVQYAASLLASISSMSRNRSMEALVTYTRQDGSTCGPLPVTSTMRMRGGGIQDYRIFMDLTPLFAG